MLFNSSSGTFGLPANYAAITPSSLALGDLSGDGKVDLAVTSYGAGTVSILTNNGAGVLGAPVNYSAGNSPASVALGDLNGDGKLDIAIANRE